MATVVITFYLFTQFYVCKMDADYKEKRRKRSLREKRWSMNSQRLEEIVAELMRPIGDLRRNFDTDLSALLEEYLTEAGLHALEADDSDEESGGALSAGAGVVPNFAELALLLQQSASIYGRKVDFLYQHVLHISDSLHNSTLEMTNTSAEDAAPADEAQTPGGSRRKRRHSISNDFSHIELEASGSARREAGAARPPPTLPRMYIELEPRVMGEGEAPLVDYAGEPIGLLTDFHVAWRIQNGLLVEELAGCAASCSAALRPIPLLELQAAIEARAPPSPPPLPPLREGTPPPPHPDEPDEPDAASTPLAREPFPKGEMPPPLLPPPVKKERKRRADTSAEELANLVLKLHISKELQTVLNTVREFDGARAWVKRVVDERSRGLLLLRRGLRRDHVAEFRGFEYCSADITGFTGWSSEEAVSAAATAQDLSRRSTRLSEDSDDDSAFFEQSSLSSEHSTDTAHTNTTTAAESARSEQESAEAAEWAAWRARLAQRAAMQESRPTLDVRATAGTVLEALTPGEEVPFNTVLGQTAKEESDVSRLFLATLFLANAGNVEVVQGAPLSLNSFSLKLISTDERLYTAAAANDPVTILGNTSASALGNTSASALGNTSASTLGNTSASALGNTSASALGNASASTLGNASTSKHGNTPASTHGSTSATTLGNTPASTLGNTSASALGNTSASTLGNASASKLGNTPASTHGSTSASTLGNTPASKLGSTSASTLGNTSGSTLGTTSSTQPTTDR